eukprot:TRINITY_DN32284_c0_g1_i3.p1 TRINITY_DN32284_c0_g1~~TRINITY_DN32284_c0_g1_i3.p1  ORF type:complete len:1142 (+),score=224.27 TRINITY_DN32284_c0_g1_i3:75-3500(+)
MEWFLHIFLCLLALPLRTAGATSWAHTIKDNKKEARGAPSVSPKIARMVVASHGLYDGSHGRLLRRHMPDPSLIEHAHNVVQTRGVITVDKFQWYGFTPLASREGLRKTRISELSFADGKNKEIKLRNFLVEVKVINGTSLTSGDVASHVVDGDKTTSLFLEVGETLAVKVVPGMQVSGFSFWTSATEGFEKLDPVSFQFEGSTDGVNWQLLNRKMNYSTSNVRGQQVGPFIVSRQYYSGPTVAPAAVHTMEVEAVNPPSPGTPTPAAPAGDVPKLPFNSGATDEAEAAGASASGAAPEAAGPPASGNAPEAAGASASGTATEVQAPPGSDSTPLTDDSDLRKDHPEEASQGPLPPAVDGVDKGTPVDADSDSVVEAVIDTGAETGMTPQEVLSAAAAVNHSMAAAAGKVKKTLEDFLRMAGLSTEQISRIKTQSTSHPEYLDEVTMVWERVANARESKKHEDPEEPAGQVADVVRATEDAGFSISQTARAAAVAAVAAAHKFVEESKGSEESTGSVVAGLGRVAQAAADAALAPSDQAKVVDVASNEPPVNQEAIVDVLHAAGIIQTTATTTIAIPEVNMDSAAAREVAHEVWKAIGDMPINTAAKELILSRAAEAVVGASTTLIDGLQELVNAANDAGMTQKVDKITAAAEKMTLDQQIAAANALRGIAVKNQTAIPHEEIAKGATMEQKLSAVVAAEDAAGVNRSFQAESAKIAVIAAAAHHQSKPVDKTYAGIAKRIVEYARRVGLDLAQTEALLQASLSMDVTFKAHMADQLLAALGGAAGAASPTMAKDAPENHSGLPSAEDAPENHSGLPIAEDPHGGHLGPPTDKDPFGGYSGSPTDEDAPENHSGLPIAEDPFGGYSGSPTDEDPYGGYSGSPNDEDPYGGYSGSPNDEDIPIAPPSSDAGGGVPPALQSKFTLHVVPDGNARAAFKAATGKAARGFHFAVSLDVQSIILYIAEQNPEMPIPEPASLSLTAASFRFDWPDASCSDEESGFTDFQVINFHDGSFENKGDDCGELSASTLDKLGGIRFPRTGDLDLFWLAGQFGNKYSSGVGGDEVILKINELVITKFEPVGGTEESWTLCAKGVGIGCPRESPLRFRFPEGALGLGLKLCQGLARFGTPVDLTECFSTPAAVA